MEGPMKLWGNQLHTNLTEAPTRKPVREGDLIHVRPAALCGPRSDILVWSGMCHSTKSLRSSPLRGARGERPVAS